MADDIDFDTCLRFKRRITELEDNQETTAEQESPSPSTDKIGSFSEEDQENNQITSSLVSDSVNIISKKVKCSPTPDSEQKKEVYGHVIEDIAGIEEYGPGFSVAEEKENTKKIEFNKLSTVSDVDAMQDVSEVLNGELAGIVAKKDMVKEDLEKATGEFSTVQEISGDYPIIEGEESMVDVQMDAFFQDVENRGLLGKDVSKCEKNQFLVESEVGSIAEAETHWINAADLVSSGEIVGEPAKIKDGFEVDANGCGNRISEIKEVNETVKNDVQKIDGHGSIKCSLKFEVIDETALIEPGSVYEIGYGDGRKREFVGFSENTKTKCRTDGKHEIDRKKEKRPRRRGKGVKKGMEIYEERNGLTHISEAQNGCVKNGCEGKKVYSRKEMEALRFLNVGKQRKIWSEVYCGLGPNVASEYNDLVNYANQKHNQLNFDPRLQFGTKKVAPPILGTACSRNVDNILDCMEANEPENMDDVGGEDGYTVPKEDSSEDGDTDEEIDSILRPAFLVEGDPDFDSGPPQDGFEYLRRVRWEAKRVPKVKVAKLDRSKLNKEQTPYMPNIPDIVNCLDHLIPSKQWEDAFLADFSKLRLALSCHEDSNAGGTCKQPFPSAGSESLDNFPTLSAILAMDSVARVSMLRTRISSVESMGTLPRSDCVWLFALCAAVDTPLNADTSASLRGLLRKCANLRAKKSELDDDVIMLNILATISGKYFGQLEK